jgi:hypothetical protein
VEDPSRRSHGHLAKPRPAYRIEHGVQIGLTTFLDLRGNIPTFIRITDGKVHDVNILDEIWIEPGAFYVMDRGYIDFERLYAFTLSLAFFVVRAKQNVLLQRRYSHPVDKNTGVRSDQTVVLTTTGSVSAYPDELRRVSYFDAVTGKRLVFLTNNFTLPALTIAQIYKQRWQVELFFKWIKQSPAHQGVLRNQRERSKDSNLDRREHVCAGRHRPQTPRAEGQPLPNPTDSQPNSIRENTHSTETGRIRVFDGAEHISCPRTGYTFSAMSGRIHCGDAIQHPAQEPMRRSGLQPNTRILPVSFPNGPVHSSGVIILISLV